MPFTGHPRASTPEWRNLRLQILDRDGHRCTWTDNNGRCTTPANEVDHIKEWADGGTDHPSNLTAICTTHHRAKTAQHANTTRWTRQTTRRPTEAHPGLNP